MAEYEGNLPIINDDTYSHKDKVEDMMMMMLLFEDFIFCDLIMIRAQQSLIFRPLYSLMLLLRFPCKLFCCSPSIDELACDQNSYYDCPNP